MKIWCCEAFEVRFKQEGSKGIFISAHFSNSNRSFFINFQSFENNVMQKYFMTNANTIPNDEKLQLLEPTEDKIIKSWTPTIRFSISYCPFCGTDLGKMIKLKQKEFDRLATGLSQPFLFDKE